MSKTPIIVSITGAAGQIGYSLLPRIASGALFGPEQPVALRLIEIEAGMKSLEGVVMELEDAAFPLLESIETTSDLNHGFTGANWALLVGSVPRKAGMERKDLLGINGKIFVGQGTAIAKNAASDIRVLVVGNPANTNCLIAMSNAPDVPTNRWHAMTRLDEDRARSIIAQKANGSKCLSKLPESDEAPRAAGLQANSIHELPEESNTKTTTQFAAAVEPRKKFHACDVKKMTIWGNHSSTLYPDFDHATIHGKSAPELIPDRPWLETDFIKQVQQRGAAIIAARGLSSALSAANAAIETVRSICELTPADNWHSVAICSDGSYGVDPGLISSFPTRSDTKHLSIIEGLSISPFAQSKIDLTIQELREERAMVAELLRK